MEGSITSLVTLYIFRAVLSHHDLVWKTVLPEDECIPSTFVGRDETSVGSGFQLQGVPVHPGRVMTVEIWVIIRQQLTVPTLVSTSGLLRLTHAPARQIIICVVGVPVITRAAVVNNRPEVSNNRT